MNKNVNAQNLDVDWILNIARMENQRSSEESSPQNQPVKFTLDS